MDPFKKPAYLRQESPTSISEDPTPKEKPQPAPHKPAFIKKKEAQINLIQNAFFRK